MSFARVCRVGGWFRFVRFALLVAVGTCIVWSFEAMPGLCRFLRVTKGQARSTHAPQTFTMMALGLISLVCGVHPPAFIRFLVGKPSPSCVVVRPLVVATPANWFCIYASAGRCAGPCLARTHVCSCAYVRCGRCLPGSGVIFFHHTASCSCLLLGSSLCWFLGFAGLTLPSPCKTYIYSCYFTKCSDAHNEYPFPRIAIFM